MKDVILNPDADYVKIITDGITKKDGHCPCKVGMLAENMCPCDEFIETKNCHCKLYLRTDVHV